MAIDPRTVQISRFLSKVGCRSRYVSSDRGVECYELDMSNFALRGFSQPVPMLTVTRWCLETQKLLVEKMQRIAGMGRIMVVAADDDEAARHVWKVLPTTGTVYLNQSKFNTITVDEDPEAIMHLELRSQIGIDSLNPIRSSYCVDPTVLIWRAEDVDDLRSIDAPIVTIPGPPLLGKTVLVRQAFCDENMTYVNCADYAGAPQDTSAMVSFLSRCTQLPKPVNTVKQFADALVKQSTSLHPVLVLDNSDTRNVYCSPTLSQLAMEACSSLLRIIIIGRSTEFQENKWLRPKCKTERFTLLPFREDLSKQFIERLFGSLGIELVDSEQVIQKLILRANSLPGELSRLCGLLIKHCIATGRNSICDLDIHRLNSADNRDIQTWMCSHHV